MILNQRAVLIREIYAEETLSLRQSVLWPSLSQRELILAEDMDGTHFGAFADHRLVSVISLFLTPSGARFRKFATEPSLQGQGIGSALLQHCINWSRDSNQKRIWCDARLSASGFYTRLGFSPQGEVFQKSGVDYIIMHRDLSLR